MNNDGMTSLHIAAKIGRKDIYEYLLQRGGNPHIRNMVGHTPNDYMNSHTAVGVGRSVYGNTGMVPGYQQRSVQQSRPQTYDMMSNLQMINNVVDQFKPTPEKYTFVTEETPLDLSSGKRRDDGPIDLTVKKAKHFDDDDIIVVSETKGRAPPPPYSHYRANLAPNNPCFRVAPNVSNPSNVLNSYNTNGHNQRRSHNSVIHANNSYTSRNISPHNAQQLNDQTGRNICAVRPQLLSPAVSRYPSPQPTYRPPSNRLYHSVQNTLNTPSIQHQHDRQQTRHDHNIPSQQRYMNGIHSNANHLPENSIGVTSRQQHNIPYSADGAQYVANGHTNFQRSVPRSTPAEDQYVPDRKTYHSLSEHIVAERQVVQKYANLANSAKSLPSTNCLQQQSPRLENNTNNKHKDQRALSARSCAIFHKEMALAKRLSDTPKQSRSNAPTVNHPHRIVEPNIASPDVPLSRMSNYITKNCIDSHRPQPHTVLPTSSLQCTKGALPVSRSVPVANVNPIMVQTSSAVVTMTTVATVSSVSPCASVTSSPKWWAQHVPSPGPDQTKDESKVVETLSKKSPTPKSRSPVPNGCIHVVRSRGTFDVPVTPQSFPTVREKEAIEHVYQIQSHHHIQSSFTQLTPGAEINNPFATSRQPLERGQHDCNRSSISTRDFSLQFLKTYGNKDSELVRKLEAEAQISQSSTAHMSTTTSLCSTSLYPIRGNRLCPSTDETNKKEIKLEVGSVIPKHEPQSADTIHMPVHSERPTALPLKLARKRHHLEASYQDGHSNSHLDGFKDVLSLPLNVIQKRYKVDPENGCAVLNEIFPSERPKADKKVARRLPAKLERKAKHAPQTLAMSPAKEGRSHLLSKMEVQTREHVSYGGRLHNTTYRRFLNGKANSDDRAGESKRTKGHASFDSTDTDTVTREERHLKRAISHFNKLEETENSRRKRSNFEDAFHSFLGYNNCDEDDEDAFDSQKRFVDFHPEILPARTRMQAASTKTGPPLPAYNKYAAYEVEIEKEEARKQLRKQLKKRERHRERKLLEGNKVLTEPRHQELLEKIKEKQRLKTARERFMPHSTHYKKKMKRLRKRRFEAIHSQAESRNIWETKKKKEVALYKSCGETILHRAARQGYLDVASECLTSGEDDVNARDNAGFSPLHECCVKGFVEMAELLLSHGADVNCSSMEGIRPIHDAVDHDHLELVRILLQHGADPSLATYSGQTPSTIADSEAMKTLIHGYLVDVNGTEEEGNNLTWNIPAPFETEACDLLNDVPSDEESTSNIVVFEMRKTPDSKSSLMSVVPYFDKDCG